jgi:hypothetical protein
MTFLTAELIRLSEATHVAYNAALDCNRPEVATELRLLADKVAALIAMTLRNELADAVLKREEDEPKIVVDPSEVTL